MLLGSLVQVSVIEDPQAWWVHAITATRHACRAIRRHQVRLQSHMPNSYQFLIMQAQCPILHKGVYYFRVCTLDPRYRAANFVSASECTEILSDYHEKE